MKKEDIEKAAEEYEDSLTYSSIKEQCDVQKAFKDGIKWFINKFLHNPSESPENGKEILIIDNSNYPIVGIPYKELDWEFIVKSVRVQKWAYIDDLLLICRIDYEASKSEN